MAIEHITERGFLTAPLLKRLLAEPVASESFAAEGTIRGLFLLRRPAVKNTRQPNRAYWVVRWSNSGKGRKKMTIGDARAISLDVARKAAQGHLAAIVQGRDPAQERREHRKRMAVADVWAAYTADPQFTSKSATTRYNDKNRYSLHVASRLGSKLIDELSHQTIENFIATIRTDTRIGKRGRKLGGEGTAKKVIHLLGAMTAWALKRKLVKSNPFFGHTLRADGQRTEIVEGPAFHAIFAAIGAMEADGRLPAVKARALRVIWATGARRSEVTGLRWRHVRLDDERIVFPANEHKGGRVASRQGREAVPRVIDLPPVAFQAIAAQLPSGGVTPIPNALVFPPMLDETKQLELSRAWREVRAAAGLPATIVLHTARHSIATAAAMAGMTGAQLAAVLGHAQTRTTERYSDLARSRKQRLGRVAFDAAMGEPPISHSDAGSSNVAARGSKP
jgi:integrase